MNLEQKLTIIYTFLGIAAGFLSAILSSMLYSIISAAAIYLVSFIFLVRFLRHKKTIWLISNSLVAFALIWLVTWILVFNLL
jgi:membrane associated rhomboid family serine protease